MHAPPPPLASFPLPSAMTACDRAGAPFPTTSPTRRLATPLSTWSLSTLPPSIEKASRRALPTVHVRPASTGGGGMRNVGYYMRSGVR